MTPTPEFSSPRTAATHLATRLRSLGVFRAADVSLPPPLAPHGDEGMGWLLRRMPSSEGVLSEWIASGEGTAVVTLALQVLKEWRRAEEPVLVVEGAAPIHPPAWRAMGLEGRRLVVVRTTSDKDRLWAIEQALRCRGVGGVIAWLGRASDRSLRRLQLALEEGRGRAFLIRPAEARREKCWGDVRFLVEPRAVSEVRRGEDRDERRSVTIELLARRGGVTAAGQTAIAEICHATGHVRLVPGLADSAPPRRAARA